MFETEVERIINVLLVIRAEVKANRKGRFGPDSVETRLAQMITREIQDLPGTSDVERELADRNGHAVDAEVAKTEDTRSVSHHGDPGVGFFGPVLEHSANFAFILD